MLDISFYAKNDEPSHTIEISEEFYKWLAESNFSKIGKSLIRRIRVEGEEEKLPLVQLGTDNRKKLKAFFQEEVIREIKTVFNKLGDSPSKQEYTDGTYRLRKLLELLECVENEKYKYLQRV